MVLRTTERVKVGRTNVGAGTRVKAMQKQDADHLKVKVKDPNYPKLNGEHVVVSFDSVERVPRGRPAVETEE
jgi:hypothetical protein